MTLFRCHTAEDASPMRGPAAAVGRRLSFYALFLLAGTGLLIDPDTLWQIPWGHGSWTMRRTRDRRLFLTCAASVGSRPSGWRR